MTATALRLGSRKSALAQAQAHWVADRLQTLNPGLRVELVLMTTTGDQTAQGSRLQAPGNAVASSLEPGAGGLKAMFTKELEDALLAERIDLAVHSLKDMPGELPPGLQIAAIPAREDARDVWISRQGVHFKDLPAGAAIATGAVRRQAQLKHLRPDLRLLNLRGNVDTRLAKLEKADYDGIILARAGLKRLGRESATTEILPFQTMLPAIGQGALAIETRMGEPALGAIVQTIDDPASHQAVLAERGFLKALGGSCQTPIAAYAECVGGHIHLTGLVVHPSGKPYLRAEEQGPAQEAESIGRALGEALLKRGAAQILAASG